MKLFTVKRLLGLIIVILLIAGLAMLIHKRKQELAGIKPPAATSATVIEVATVRAGDLTLGARYLGELVPATETAIASKVSGFIERINVNEGDHVKEGMVLTQIDDSEIRQRIRQIEAQIETTRNNVLALEAKNPGLEAAALTSRGIWDRDRLLYDNKAIAREELDISEKNYRLAASEVQANSKSIQALQSSIASLQAEKKEQEVLLGYTAIRAPFAATVSEKNRSVGDLSVAGQPIIKLVCPEDGVKVVVPMAIEDLAKVTVGTPAMLFFDGRSIAAKVSAVYPATTADSLGICNIFLPNPPFNLPFHSKIEVQLALRKVTGLVAPLSCLLQRDGQSMVIKVDAQNQAQILPIELMGADQSEICFASGTIQPGDRLVSGRESRLMRIFSGQQLTVASASQ